MKNPNYEIRAVFAGILLLGTSACSNSEVLTEDTEPAKKFSVEDTSTWTDDNALYSVMGVASAVCNSNQNPLSDGPVTWGDVAARANEVPNLELTKVPKSALDVNDKLPLDFEEFKQQLECSPQS